MLIVIIAALIGIWRYRSIEYFKWVGIATLWMLAGGILFSGGGTLENPSGDGLIAHQIRIATQDGIGMGIFAVVFLVVYWGGVVFFITRMVKAARSTPEADELALEHEDYEYYDNTGRKSVETLVLLAVAAAWGWFAFIRPETDRYEALTTAESAEPAAPVASSIEQQIMGSAAELNATAPQKIDDSTTLERASASGRTLTYHFRIKANEQDRERLRRFILKTVVPKVCTGELRPSMRDNGVSYVYSYVGTGFSKPVEVTVTEQTCADLEP